jgi:DNA primase
MQFMITKDSIENLKNHLDVVDVISQFLEIKKSGANFKACCPFHGEKTPSFVISPAKQIYHCFGCLPAFQEVCTPNGYKKIEDIKVGDTVFTMMGYPTKVIETVNHTSEFDILGFQTSLSKEASFFTQNHDMMVVQKEEAIEKLPYLRVEKSRPLKFYGRIKKSRKEKNYNLSIKDIFANDVKVGDYFLYPVQRTILVKQTIDVEDLWIEKNFGPNVELIKHIKLNENFLWLSGIYIAEGSSYRGGIKFSLSSKEIDYAEKIVSIVQTEFNKKATIFYPKGRNNSLEVTISSTNLQYIFENLFNKGAENKQYPYWFNYLDKKLRKALFKGLMDGDGCYKTNTYDTISKTLANQILDLAISLEKIPTCRIYEASTDKNGINHKKSYTIYFKKRESIESFFEEINQIKYFFIKVKDIQNVGYEDLVYDITVEDSSHTFLSKHFAVGNCGVGGDAIKFMMEYEKLAYPEAIEKLASMYNVTLSYDNNNQKKQDTKVLEATNQYYQKLFTQNQEAKEYIKQRGISEFSIEKFEIGYAPHSAQTIEYLKNNYFNLGDAKELGVIDTGENGLYARFIQRITFPIYALNGKIVGFGGRTITGHVAKYVNSPQTKLFNKSRLLYGYHLAKEHIYKQKEIIITEGYLDVIMLHQAGFENAVATLGTALTQEHLPLLRRGEPKIVVAYDGDSAGLNAAYKAALMLSHGNFEGGVVIFEAGLDPADMVKNQQINQLAEIFAHPKPFIPFVLDLILKKFDLNDPLQKQKALAQSNEYLKTLSPLVQDEYKSYLASRLNINEKYVKVQNSFQKQHTQNSRVRLDIAELGIIKSIADNADRLQWVLDVIDASMFEYHKEEFELLLSNKQDPKIMQILLNEQLETYDNERLSNELRVLLIKFYEKKLHSVKYSTQLDHNAKKNLIIKIKDNMVQLKKGKLIAYNLDEF